MFFFFVCFFYIFYFLIYLDSNPVRNFLCKLDLVEYFCKFEEEGFDELDLLFDLDHDELKQLGVYKLGHRKKILTAINQLKNQ